MRHKKQYLKELIVSLTENFSPNALYFCKLYPSIQLVKSEIGSNAPALFSFSPYQFYPQISFNSIYYSLSIHRLLPEPL